MSKVKSSKSKYSKHSAQASSNPEPLRLQQAKILAPIYDKVAMLRQELDSKTPPPTIFMD